MDQVIIALSISPILLIIFLLLMRIKIYFAAVIAYIYTLAVALVIWQMDLGALASSTIKGILVASDIILIVFGAIFFLEFLKAANLLGSIENYLSKISPDARIQAILIAWLFGSFIEGTAGFGTPAAIVAPLLIGIGFPALMAISVALIANSTAVTFGAVGTPIRVGFSGLETSGVASYAGAINLFVGIFVPIMILAVVVMFSKNKSSRSFYEAVPLAIFAGMCFVMPYYLLTFLGSEFPSLLGSLIGMGVFIFATKKGFLVPKNKLSFMAQKKSKSSEKIINSFLPYIFLVVFLLAGKFVFGSFVIGLYSGINHKINLFNPGMAFISSIVLFSLIFPKNIRHIKGPAITSFKTLLAPFIVIFSIVSFVQIMIYSGINDSALDGMIINFIAIVPTSQLHLLAPFIGAFGSFVSGSATLSNILFGSFLDGAARASGFNHSIILALQLVGAGIGNMIALTNIVAAQAAAKVKGMEIDILKTTMLPCLILLIIASIVGAIIISFF
jgi:lactate permease